MDAVPSLHPSDQTLSSYGLGKLDDSSAEAVDKHLAECPDCRKRVAEMSADSFLDRVRDVGKGHADASGAPPRPASTLPPELASQPHYQVKRELGRGGMGVVYLAHNTLMGRDEVLKVMGREILQRPNVVERFLREIRAVGKLRHPNIVTAYSAVRLGDSLIFAMEYVEGLDLARLVKAKGPLPVSHACHFVYQAALGLQHAHEEGLVHRDIKPANLMLTRKADRATVKVLDFGLAKAALDEKVDGSLTREGQALGTPDYIAPEQIVDAPTADIRADIYSLGGTLYYLLTGRPPFQAKSLYDIYQAHISRDADPLNLVRPEVPAELAALVAKMMAKDPARRFQTPLEVARALAPVFKRDASASVEPTVETSRPAPPIVGHAKVAEPPQATMIEMGEPEPDVASDPSTLVAESSRRPPWKSPPVVAAWALFGVILLGVIVVIISRSGRVSVETTPGKTTVTVHESKGAAPVAAQAARPSLNPSTEPNPWPTAQRAGGIALLLQGDIVAMSRDCRLLAVRLLPRRHVLRIVTAPDGANVVDLDQEKFIKSADFSPDGKSIVVGCAASSDNVWDITTGKEVAQLGGPGELSTYTQDGKRIAQVGGIWDAGTGKKLVSLPTRPNNTACMALSPDGLWLATGGNIAPGGTTKKRATADLKLWSLVDRSNWDLAKRTLVNGVAFSPDSQRLVSANYDRTAKVWDVSTKKCLLTFVGHPTSVNSARFSPDGLLIASIGQENVARVWEAATGREVAVLQDLPAPARMVEFSPEGGWILATSGKTLKVWPAPASPSGPAVSEPPASR